MTEDLQVGIGDALSTDYFVLRDQLTDTQRDYLARALRFVDDEVLPTINDYWDRADFPWPLVEKLGTSGLVGDGIAGYGCPPMDPLSAGLITMELSRGDGSIGTFVGVQAGLAMRSIAYCGSQEQKQFAPATQPLPIRLVVVPEYADRAPIRVPRRARLYV